MKRVTILGLGSRIMTDDGIGVYIVEDLQQLLRNEQIQFVIAETDVDYCISEISGAKRVIIIDAYISGRHPGEITVIPLSDLKKQHKESYSSHEIHALDIIQSLNCEIQGSLIGIEPCEIDYGVTLSETLKSRYAAIFESIYKIIQNVLI